VAVGTGILPWLLVALTGSGFDLGMIWLLAGISTVFTSMAYVLYRRSGRVAVEAQGSPPEDKPEPLLSLRAVIRAFLEALALFLPADMAVRLSLRMEGFRGSPREALDEAARRDTDAALFFGLMLGGLSIWIALPFLWWLVQAIVAPFTPPFSALSCICAPVGILLLAVPAGWFLLCAAGNFYVAWAAAKGPEAYERLVERRVESRRKGE
jgi:hypothetical protein